jgi:hypothetical protein
MQLLIGIIRLLSKRPIEKWTKKLGEKLGENEIKIIELMKDNKYITAKELSEYIKISTSDTPSPLRGRIKVGVRHFLSLQTLFYQGAAISISPLSFPRLSACVPVCVRTRTGRRKWESILFCHCE